MDASRFSKKYYDKYNLPIEQINTSLFKNTIFGDYKQLGALPQPQIILFNPPYIPVEEE
jgi:methylase of polypeptide subunit release factors